MATEELDGHSYTRRRIVIAAKPDFGCPNGSLIQLPWCFGICRLRGQQLRKLTTYTIGYAGLVAFGGTVLGLRDIRRATCLSAPNNHADCLRTFGEKIDRLRVPRHFWDYGEPGASLAGSQTFSAAAFAYLTSLNLNVHIEFGRNTERSRNWIIEQLVLFIGAGPDLRRLCLTIDSI